MKKNACVIFGGLGYVGLFLAKNIIESKLYDKVVLTDISTIDDISFYRQNLIKNLDYEYQKVDVREEISLNLNYEISVLPTLNITHLLERPELKKYAWEDMKLFRDKIKEIS